MIAQLKGVWDIISNEEPIIPRPQKQDYFKALKPSKEKGSDDTLMSDGTQPTISNEATDNSSRIAEYRINLEEYERNNKRVRTAAALLQYWVDPAIHGTIQSYMNPVDAWNYIQSQYKMQDARSLDIALATMEKITLATCPSVQEYLNQHEMSRLDIKDAGGDYTDAQLMSKLIRGLTQHYNAFVDQYHLLHDIDGLKAPDLKGLASRLLTFESKLRERNIGKATTVNHLQQERRFRDKCTAEGCGKWGHKTEKCWVMHPELKNSRNTHESDRANTKPRKVTAMAVVNRNTLKALLQGDDDLKDDHCGETTSKIRDSKEAEIEEMVINQIKPGIGLTKAVFDTIRMLVESDSIVDDNSWILDSGANVHLVNRVDWFTAFKPITYSVGTADSSGVLDIKGGGTVSLLMLPEEDHDESVELELTTVAYAPNLRCNVMSMSTLTEAGGLHGIWNQQGIKIHSPDGSPVGTARLTDGLYEVKVDITNIRRMNKQLYQTEAEVTSAQATTEIGDPESSAKVVTAIVNFLDPVWVWHRRMGHLGIKGLRRLLKISNGMNLTDKQIKGKLGTICPICATTKSVARIPCDPASRRFKEPGQLIHVDTWGPYSISGWEKTKYFLIFVDDATRFVWHRRLAARADMAESFWNLHKSIEKEHNITIRRYRTDNEFNTKVLDHWASKYGISWELSAPYQHHQVGVVERSHRVHRDMTAALLQELSVSGQIVRIIQERGTEML